MFQVCRCARSVGVPGGDVYDTFHMCQGYRCARGVGVPGVMCIMCQG